MTVITSEGYTEEDLVKHQVRYDTWPCGSPPASGQRQRYPGRLPKPKHILREAVRLVEPGGLIGILHIIIIPAYSEYGVVRLGIHPILAGPNNALRVFNVFRT